MNRKHIIAGCVVILAAGLGLVALVKSHGGATETSGHETIPTIVTVQTGLLKLATLHQYVQAYGTVEPAPASAEQPAASSQLSSPSAGVVTRVNVVEGQQVAKGDVLMELNSSTTTADNAAQQVERQKVLYAQQNTSLKNLQDAEAQLALLRVVAPLAGTVTRLNVRPGQAVDLSTVVAEVIDLNRLAVTAEIPAPAASGLKPGNEVELMINPAVTSKLSFVSPAVNPNNGTVLVRALLPAGGTWRPGQFVPLRIITAVHTNTLVAPAESVVTDEKGNSLIALVTGDEASTTPVQAGLRENGLVEVQAPGLKPGDTVVTVGAYGLPDKTKISVENSSGDEAPTNSTAAP